MVGRYRWIRGQGGILLREAWGGRPSTARCCTDGSGRRRRRTDAATSCLHHPGAQPPLFASPTAASSFLLIPPSSSGWWTRCLHSSVSFPLLRRAGASPLRHLSSSAALETSSGGSQSAPNTTTSLEKERGADPAVALASSGVVEDSGNHHHPHQSRRNDRGGHHRRSGHGKSNHYNYYEENGRRRRRVDDNVPHRRRAARDVTIPHVLGLLSSVPLGRMSEVEHGLTLEAIRRFEQGLRIRDGKNDSGGAAHARRKAESGQSRTTAIKNKDLELWRGAVDLLRRLEQEHHAQNRQQQYFRRRGRTGARPPPSLPVLTTTPYNRLLRGAARIPHLTAAEKVGLADDVLHRMLHDSGVNGTGGANAFLVPTPDRYTYQAYLYACVEASNDHPGDSQIALDKAQELIQHLESQVGENDENALVPRSYYDAIIQIHSNQAAEVYGAAAAAEDALLLLSERSTSRPDLQPTAESFNRVLKAWSVCREDNGADRAYEILKLQLSLGASAAPDSVSFGTVMAAFGTRHRPDDAQDVWDRCVEFPRQERGRGGDSGSEAANDRSLTDLTGCFEILVAAWSQSRRPEAIPRIKDLIRTVVHGSNEAFLVRDTPTIHSCLVHAMVAKGDVFAAHAYLVDMVQRCRQGTGPIPMSRTFHAVFGGWKDVIAADPSQVLIAAQRSLDLFHEMLNLEADCPTDASTNYLVTDVLCHALAATKSLPPDSVDDVAKVVRQGMEDVVRYSELRRQSLGVMYHRIVQSLCRHSTPESSRMAAQVLNNYYEQARQRRDVEWIPKQTTGLYTSVIAALGSCRTLETTEQALELLRSMPSLSGKAGRDLALVPTVRTYTSALRAVGWLRNERSAQVAAELFEELQRFDADPDHRVKFDGVVFAVLLEASAANVELCRQIISKLVTLRRSGRTGFDDDVERCKAAFVQALVKSGECERVAIEEVTGMFS